jgi:type IV pilus assembly protein PilV
MNLSRFKRRPGQHGVALIEALIGILIFAFGVLGLVGLQASMTRAQTAGKFRADAANLVADLFGLIQTDHRVNMGLYHEVPAGTSSCSGYKRCAEWKAKVAKVLPSGAISVTVDPVAGTVKAEVRWTQGGGDTNMYQSTMSWQQ